MSKNTLPNNPQAKGSLKSQIGNISFALKKLEKEEYIKPKTSRREKIKEQNSMKLKTEK